MKNSDRYFIQFSKPIKVENGEPTDEFLPYILHIDICKRIDEYYKTTFIEASDGLFGRAVNDYVDSWQYIRSNFNPRWKGCIIYEVPEELNDLFGAIQVEAQNY